jgi:hypothetical protein
MDHRLIYEFRFLLFAKLLKEEINSLGEFYILIKLIWFMKFRMLQSPPFSLPMPPLITSPRYVTIFFPLSQDELVASALSSDNVLSYLLLSQAETETLNLHHRRRLLSLNRQLL